jgi:periplasmic divalent cation tolerance protein
MGRKMEKYIVVFITYPENADKDAKELAKKLVEEKLAACVNIVSGINSVYFWQGNIEDDMEKLLIVKTKASLFEELKKFVKENHPYTVPEIIAMPIILGNEDYLNWLEESTK